MRYACNISKSGVLRYLVHDVSVLRPGKLSASVSVGQRGGEEGGQSRWARFKANVPSVSMP